MRDQYSQRVAENLQLLLEQTGITKHALREKLGTSSTAIYDFLASDTASVSIRVLGRFAEALEVPIEVFFAKPGKLTALIELHGKICKLKPNELDLLSRLAVSLLPEEEDPRSG